MNYFTQRSKERKGKATELCLFAFVETTIKTLSLLFPLCVLCAFA